MRRSFLVGLPLLGAAAAQRAFSLDTTDAIRSSAATLATDLLSLYPGSKAGNEPGILSLPPPSGDYYWWEGGAFVNTLVDYFAATGDATHNDIVTEAVRQQMSQQANFMPLNWSTSIGNEDQCIWALAAMSAAEAGFPGLTTGNPTWLDLAKNVFNDQADRIGAETACEGGLRWQILPFLNGYNYKNSASNGCFFTLSARLARFTGNQTYARFAEDTWDWMSKVGFISPEFAVFDGAHVETNCSNPNKAQFSYTAAAVAQGAAFMYNFTNGDSAWRTRTEGLTTNILSTFFPNGVIFEVACERSSTCTVDMFAFKGMAHRWLASVAQVAPFTASRITGALRSSAQAAVNQCTGPPTDRACGFYWAEGKFVPPSTTGTGEQMSVLAAVESLLLVGGTPGTSSTSGTGPGAGTGTGTGSGSGTTTSGAPAPSNTSGVGRLSALSEMVVFGLFGMVAWATLSL